MRKSIFLLRIKMHMSLRREGPETDDFLIKKYMVVKEKYLKEITRNCVFLFFFQQNLQFINNKGRQMPFNCLIHLDCGEDSHCTSKRCHKHTCVTALGDGKFSSYFPLSRAYLNFSRANVLFLELMSTFLMVMYVNFC